MEKDTIIAIIAIVSGAIGLIFPPFILGFVAIILGFYLYSKDNKLGLIGLILGVVGIIINTLMIIGIVPWFYGLIQPSFI